MTVTRSQPLQIPASARRLGPLVWAQAQQRMRQRYGFDLAFADASARVDAIEGLSEAETQLLHAALFATRGDASAALVAARRAVELDGSAARAHTTLAGLLMNGGDREGGLAAARHAASLDAEDVQVVYNLGLAEHFAGDPRVGAECFQRTAQLLGVAHSRWQFWRR